ncbi:hypothetical protein JXQ70_08555 [bacterium]|nr:hypothetical protein [bacterium]
MTLSTKIVAMSTILICFFLASPMIASADVPSIDTGSSETIAEIQDTTTFVLPEGLQVKDVPNDEGDALVISWEKPEDGVSAEPSCEYWIVRSDAVQGPFTSLSQVFLLDGEYLDTAVQDGNSYCYKFRIKRGDQVVDSPVLGPVIPKGSWFDVHRINALIFLVVFSFLILFYINQARHGKELFIRKVSGLDSVAEAVGRATEMGRKILYIPGIADISEIQTVAGLSILGHIAKTAVEYASRILVPNMDPLTYAASREIVKEAYLTAGRPEAFHEEDVYFITSEQFAYTASVSGMMVREKPAANFFIGWFKAESLMLAETGQSTGAIQIAGTAELDQLPFFVATCDYTLIGEELYAASAYLTHQPLLLGSIKGQDIAKAFLIGIIVIGLLTSFFNVHFIRDFLTIQ